MRYQQFAVANNYAHNVKEGNASPFHRKLWILAGAIVCRSILRWISNSRKFSSWKVSIVRFETSLRCVTCFRAKIDLPLFLSWSQFLILLNISPYTPQLEWFYRTPRDYHSQWNKKENENGSHRIRFSSHSYSIKIKTKTNFVCICLSAIW